MTQIFDLRPAAILRDLDLRRPIYKRTAAYGHFGRPAVDGGFTWERTDQVDDLRVGARALTLPFPPSSPPPAAPARPEAPDPTPAPDHDPGASQSARADALVVRVLPDQPAIAKTFDYLVPEHLAGEVARRHDGARGPARPPRGGLGRGRRRRAAARAWR